MNRLQIIQRVRSLTRDFTNTVFRENDIIDYINEGIDRFAQVIPELQGLEYLLTNTQEPSLIPRQYQHLLAVYATSRCFNQDERHYQATTYMNEFEVKLEELKQAIEAGSVVITDAEGNEVSGNINIDYVNLEPYWGIKARPTVLLKPETEPETIEEED